MPDGMPQDVITRAGLPLQTRAALCRSYDAESREFDMVITTAAPVRRRDYRTGRAYDEVLSMSDGAVRLDRAQTVAPILDSHSSWRITDAVGAIVPGSVRVDGDALVGRGRLTSADDAMPARQRLADGTIRTVSAGYIVHDWEVTRAATDTQPEERTAVDWELYEVSMVAVPADARATIRSDVAGSEPAEQEQQMSQPIDLGAERAAAAADERARVREITALGRRHGVDVTAMVDDGRSVADARTAILDDLAARSAAQDVGGAQAGIRVTSDHGEQAARGIVDALAIRAGARDVELTPAARAHMGTSLMRLAEDCVRAQGIDPRQHSERQVAELALQARRGQPMATRAFSSALSTGDFPLLLANVANKFLNAGFGEEPMTHEAFVYDRQVRDTKQVSILSLGSVDALPTVAEGTEYTYATMTEAREVYTLAKFGKILPLTIETLLNDDLSAFGRATMELGRAAMRAEKGLIYGASGVLGASGGAGETMAAHGSIAAATLIHSTHGNAGTGGALSATTLAELRKLMLSQIDDDGNLIGGLMPQILLVPAALLDTAEILQQQRYVATTAGAGAAAWISGLRVIVEPRLDSISATRYWVMSGRPFVERARLAGEPMPVVTTIEQPEADQIGYKVRYWCAAKAADWRDVASNAGV